MQSEVIIFHNATHKHLLNCTRCIFTDECKMCFSFVLSRITIFKYINEFQIERELAHNRGLAIVGNQPTSVEWKDVSYTVQRLMALHGHPHGKSTVLHMSNQHAPNSLENWVTDPDIQFPSSSGVLLCYIPHFDHVQVILSNSRLYCKSLHAIRELVCVC